jgi:voltage-gated potassium channel
VPRRDHVVVCGAGTTGSTIIEALSEAGVRCVAVERDEDALDAAFVKRLRLPVVIGDIASGTTLDGLRLGSARALLAVTKDDMANLQPIFRSFNWAPRRFFRRWGREVAGSVRGQV